jgi:hypothetical protein
VVPSWPALCLIAQGSGFESQRGHLFFGISPRGEISHEGFAQGLVSPPATSRYIGSVRIAKRNLENEKYLENARVNIPPIRMPLKKLNGSIPNGRLSRRRGPKQNHQEI